MYINVQIKENNEWFIDGWVEDTSFRVSCQDDGPDPPSG